MKANIAYIKDVNKINLIWQPLKFEKSQSNAPLFAQAYQRCCIGLFPNKSSGSRRVLKRSM
ncbi:hypothetical protein PPNK14_18640 [Pectobacterium parmentieri]